MTESAADVSRVTLLRRKSTWLWLGVYVLLLSAIVFGMLRLRHNVLKSLDTPQARAEWQKWRESEPNNQQADLPVKRRPPKSTEPPTLVLLRDYFGVMLSAAVVFGSLLFAAIVIAARGALSQDHARGPTPH